MSNRPNKLGYIPDICPCCKQTCTYIFSISQGSVESLKKIARFVQTKGKNVFHIRKELEEAGIFTSSQTANMSILRSHGLIARYKVNGERVVGNYVLTSKGAAFLKGEPIPRYAIISKAEKHQVGYFAPEIHTCRINDFNESETYWDGIGFEIVSGEVVINNQASLL